MFSFRLVGFLPRRSRWASSDQIGIAVGERQFDARARAGVRSGAEDSGHPVLRTFIVTEDGFGIALPEVPPTRLHPTRATRRRGAKALAVCSQLERLGGDVLIAETRVRFLPGSPDGRPERVAVMLG